MIRRLRYAVSAVLAALAWWLIRASDIALTASERIEPEPSRRLRVYRGGRS